MSQELARRSAVEAASQCLYRYNQIWLCGVDDQSDYAARGIAFHACAHRYIERLVAKELVADHEEAVVAFIEGIATSRLPGRLVKEVRELYDRWAERFALDLDHFLAAEERQDNPDSVFTPDLVYARPHELEMQDWKTFFVALTETQAREDWQARFYVRNAMKKWPGFPSYRFTFVFVRLGKTLSLTFSPTELDALERDVAAVLAQVQESRRTGIWPATPGGACAYCELKCPIIDQPALMPKRFLAAEQVPQFAAWVLAADQMLKQGKKALKAYCVANGPVMVGNVEYANRPVLERKYPVDALMKVLEARNLMGAFDQQDQAKGLTISHSALSKLFKQFPLLEKDLAEAVQEKTSYRFSARKPGVGDDEESE